MKKCRIFKLGWHLAHCIQIPILKLRILISQFLFVSCIKNQSDWKRNQENAGFIIVSELVAGSDEYHFRIGKYVPVKFSGSRQECSTMLDRTGFSLILSGDFSTVFKVLHSGVMDTPRK